MKQFQKRKYEETESSDSEHILEAKIDRKPKKREKKEAKYEVISLAAQRNEKLLSKQIKENNDYPSQELIEEQERFITEKIKHDKEAQKELMNVKRNSLDKYEISNYKFELVNEHDNFKNRSDLMFLQFLKLFCGCDIVSQNEDRDIFEYEILMRKESNKNTDNTNANFSEEARFILKFDKNNLSSFVEYIPIKITFQFNQDDIVYDNVEIHKEDLYKFLKKLLDYKVTG